MNSKTFRTKTGFCHILPDKIILDARADFDESINYSTSESISKYLIFYLIFAAWMAFLSYDQYSKNEHYLSLFSGISSVLLLFNIYWSRNNSTTPLIERKSIQSIRFNKGLIGFTRPRFVVIYANKKGQLKNRLILLPGTIAQKKNDIDNALEIMTEEGLLDKN